MKKTKITNLIGISGKIGSGKDTVAEIIQYLTNRNTFKTFEDFREANIKNKEWEIKRFSDKLKDIVCILLDCSREQLEDREFKETTLGKEWDYYKKGLELIPTSPTKSDIEDIGYDRIHKHTPRTLLQLMGTECGRNIIHHNIWVNSLIRSIKDDSKIIIPDVRFENEADAIVKRSGLLLRVERDLDTNIEVHKSETSLDSYKKFDYTIYNYSDIACLVGIVKSILTKEKILWN